MTAFFKHVGSWPMSHLVMLHGIVLSLATGIKIVLSQDWAPPPEWLLYLGATLTATFATKRLTWKPGSPQDKEASSAGGT